MKSIFQEDHLQLIENRIIDERKNVKQKLIHKSLKIILLYFCLLIIFQSKKVKRNYFHINLNQNIPIKEESNIKVALCTMGKYENLYANEFVEYYIKLGIDHIFIYDDNDPNTEKISDAIENKNKLKVTIYDNIKDTIKNQSDAFNDCYHKNILNYDWFLMVDMDEFLYIVNDSLKSYLSKNIFDKCDFIKFHWATSTDNNLVHYDPRPLFQRFKPPYLLDIIVKTIIRSNISDMHYWVHSPDYSPKRNVTCNNKGDILDISNGVNIESVGNVNVEKAFLIHHRFKSTEEFIQKYKRGYSNWFGDGLNWFLENNLRLYLTSNNLTMEKINYISSELNLYLLNYRIKYLLGKIFFMNY